MYRVTAIVLIAGGCLLTAAAWGDGDSTASPTTTSTDPHESGEREFGANAALRRPEIPAAEPGSGLTNPIDRLLEPYFRKHEIEPASVVPDRIFARRVSLDLVGLLPTPEQLAELAADPRPPEWRLACHARPGAKGGVRGRCRRPRQTACQADKRDRFVRMLLDDREAYASHWLTFWNDALRNAYRGTGFIDDGRRQITGWLFGSLYENKPYDRFVRELISPVDGSEGFVKGIKWRGVVNASQRPELQAAQNISQVFMGTNLKCASCHDSFIDEWTLADAYALANIFAEEPLETHYCDKSIGETVPPRFIFGSEEAVDPTADRSQRMDQLAVAITRPDNARFARTIVNRLWAQLMGRGLVEPVDEMDNEPVHADLLDWLAWDFVDHGYDLKHTLETICTSRAYQRATVGAQKPGDSSSEFRGPVVKRMTAEQFIDAVFSLTGCWPEPTAEMEKVDGRGQSGQLMPIRGVLGIETSDREPVANHGEPGDRNGEPADDNAEPAKAQPIRIRASWLNADPLSRGLGRPNREQVVTRRDSFATMLQALELTNGETLAALLRKGAARWIEESGGHSERLIIGIYQRALSREPTADELSTALKLIGSPPAEEGVADLLWIIVMLPEFQLID